MSAHSDLGASIMYRWSACPGSVRLCRTAPERPVGKAAEEGTLAHELASKVLLNILPLDDIDDIEMRDAIKVYVDLVESYYDPSAGDQLFIEHKFDLSKVYPGCFGTGDAVVWKPKTKHLIVIDLKYGTGIRVSAINNPQLRYYGLGALVSLGLDAENVTLIICQPRLA